MRQEDQEVRPRRGERVRDNTVRVALISATGTVLAAALTAAGSFSSGWVTYTGPGAGPVVSTVVAPPSTVTVTPGPDTTSEPLGRDGSASGSVSLTDLDPVERYGSYSTGALRVNTKPYSDTVYQYPGCTEKHSVTYQLDRKYARFEATVGPSDESLSGYTTFFTVTVDGREELEQQVAVGESAKIRPDVTGGYRMTLSVIGARPDGCIGDLVAVWAEPLLVPGT